MQNQPLLQLAKKSAMDASFMGSLIQQQATREQISWEKMADLLNISEAQLTRLALCKLPRDEFFSQDVGQIVGYSGINRVVLLHFLDCAQKGVCMAKRTQPSATPQRQTRKKKYFWQKEKFFMVNRRAWAFSLAALLILMFGAFVLAQSGQTEATLVVSMGEAVVNQAGGAIFAGSAETAVASGELTTVTEGDTIRLSENSSAQLRLQDGSTVDLFSGTTVTVSELVMEDDNQRFQLSLLAGKTLSRVARLLRPNDAFEIKTPSSTASVRGTIFMVEVQNQDSSHIFVEEGVVRVTLGNDQFLDVPAGFQVTAVAGQPLQLRPNNEPAATPIPTEEPESTGTPTNTPVPTEEKTEPENDIPEGPPEQVPGNTPDEVPGEGDPPEGGGTPPGQVDNPGDSDDAQADKIIVCHYPAGDTNNGNALEINVDSLADHLAHGDTVGACPEPSNNDGSSSDASGDTPGSAPGNNDGDDSPGNSGNAPGNNDGDDSPGSSGSAPGNNNDGNPGNSGGGGGKP